MLLKLHDKNEKKTNSAAKPTIIAIIMVNYDD